MAGGLEAGAEAMELAEGSGGGGWPRARCVVTRMRPRRDVEGAWTGGAGGWLWGRPGHSSASSGCRAPMGLSVRFAAGLGSEGPGMRGLGVPGASTAPLTRWGEMGSAPFIAAISGLDGPSGASEAGGSMGWGPGESLASGRSTCLGSGLEELTSQDTSAPALLGVSTGSSSAGGRLLANAKSGWAPGS